MKRQTRFISELMLAVVGIMLITAITTQLFSNHLAHLMTDAIWLIFIFCFTNYNSRMRTKRLRKMWQLADQLGYGPDDLKQLAPKYGRLDWAASRPENQQFLPSDRVVSQLINQFQAEVNQHEHIA